MKKGLALTAVGLGLFVGGFFIGGGTLPGDKHVCRTQCAGCACKCDPPCECCTAKECAHETPAAEAKCDSL